MVAIKSLMKRVIVEDTDEEEDSDDDIIYVKTIPKGN
jgi:hypothetical protein